MAIRHETVVNSTAVCYHGITVYNTHEDDNIFSPTNEHIFSLDTFGSEKDVRTEGSRVFDIRELKTYDKNLTAQQNLLRAIDEDLLGETNIHIREAGIQEYVSQANGADERRCPVCNAYLSESDYDVWGDSELSEDCTRYEFECQCPRCKANFRQVFRLEFDGFEIE